ncbi:glycogen synthase kinase-3 alpha [Anaeramoeba flamelloides]|uniref:Glycogen synthase kinase-3 alpha n=1 Tax=Anaeramoeba flamelloides TaxID=1746091 RepID=A0ABQ8Z739_9EUKA|nr:glycogen synthase kinase-3 alpha [Anaeramoeba flamelloides]
MSLEDHLKNVCNCSKLKLLGAGAFGVVYKARSLLNGSNFAIKTVYLDPRYRNRELQIMKKVNHKNIVKLQNYFYTQKNKKELYLHLILEFVPKTLSQLSMYYHNQFTNTPMLLVKVYTYQLCRAVAKIHSLGICHRDIKPDNILVSPRTSELKLCDFGSAKILKTGETNTSYICSRHYRAPELIFGATDYDTSIDLWSIGCILAELLLGRVFFAGKNTLTQLVAVIKVLGTPSKKELSCMNKNYGNFNLPELKAKNLRDFFPKRVPDEAVDLVSKFLKYDPKSRINALQACTHPFFNDLRIPNTRLPNKRNLPKLFDFSSDELESVNPQLQKILKNKINIVTNNKKIYLN